MAMKPMKAMKAMKAMNAKKAMKAMKARKVRGNRSLETQNALVTRQANRDAKKALAVEAIENAALYRRRDELIPTYKARSASKTEKLKHRSLPRANQRVEVYRERTANRTL